MMVVSIAQKEGLLGHKNDGGYYMNNLTPDQEVQAAALRRIQAAFKLISDLRYPRDEAEAVREICTNVFNSQDLSDLVMTLDNVTDVYPETPVRVLLADALATAMEVIVMGASFNGETHWARLGLFTGDIIRQYGRIRSAQAS
jgi:hypothetical protein